MQTSVAVLDTPLREVTFVVLDLETTGLSPTIDRITEVGAVKVRGGEILGELQCLVSPGVSIPAGVSALTGITEAMVADRPPLEAVLPTLLEFTAGSTIVGHNVRFDLGFLRAALERHDYPRLRLPVVDTARLARRALARDEVRDCRLSTLAQHLHARVTPNHRALSDARATVDVFHGLLERVGSLGVSTLEDLRAYCTSHSDAAFRKRRLVKDAPEAPGVYRFLDRHGGVLHVGKAANLRLRLRLYFGADRRRRIADLVRETTAVEWDTTPTGIEAEVRELRALRVDRPRYNRRARTERAVYVRLTRERFPRLSIVRTPRAAGQVLGPVGSRSSAEQFVEAVHEVIPLRQCTQRLTPDRPEPACLLKGLGRCGAPCDGSQPQGEYADVVGDFQAAVLEDPSRLLARLRARVLGYAAQGRFEQSRAARQRLHHAAWVLTSTRRITSLAAVEEIVACRQAAGHLEVVLVRAGRLVGSARLDAVPSTAGSHDRAVLALASRISPIDAEHRGQGVLGPVAAPSPEETKEVRLLADWLARPGVRLVRVSGTYAEPVPGGRALHATLAEAGRVKAKTTHARTTLPASGSTVSGR